MPSGAFFHSVLRWLKSSRLRQYFTSNWTEWHVILQKAADHIYLSRQPTGKLRILDRFSRIKSNRRVKKWLLREFMGRLDVIYRLRLETAKALYLLACQPSWASQKAPFCLQVEVDEENRVSSRLSNVYVHVWNWWAIICL